MNAIKKHQKILRNYEIESLESQYELKIEQTKILF